MEKKDIDILKTENECMKVEIAVLQTELEKEKNSYIKLDENWLLIKHREADLMQRNSILESENEKLNTENQQLREKIAEASKKCKCDRCSCEDDIPFLGYEENEVGEVDLEAVIYELQDQHQQDCVRINDLTTTINVLSGLYDNLRKKVED